MQLKQVIMEKAANYFAGGYNCCQSVLLAANDVWSLDISRDLIAAAHFFRNGMASGCSCGALVGMEMTLGVIQERKGVVIKPRAAKQLHDVFVNSMGSSCCRVLRKKQGLIARTTHQGCKDITAEAAGMIYELLQDSRLLYPA